MLILCLQGMPKEIKQPDPFYGTTGVFGYYQALLKPISQYPDLSTEVCVCVCACVYSYV